MANLRSVVAKVRSKNAGPFWLTIDVFCGSENAYETVVQGLATEQVAEAFGIDAKDIKRFEIPSLNVVKFSLPRPAIQGSVSDRDMHGASWSALVGEIEIG